MITIAENEKPIAAGKKLLERPNARELRDATEKHAIWLDSRGVEGLRADLSGKNLEGADMVDARLADSLLHKTILKGADLTLTDFRDATLVQANLSDANLLGTEFQQANLQAADLRGATGLLSAQLAGSNLFGASLPDSVSPAAGLKLLRGVADRAAWLLGVALLLNGLVWLRIFTTQDSPLVKNGSAFPFAGLQTMVPFIPFYLFGPVVILCLYLWFHLYMQRLWDGIAQLPAIFPDGTKLDTCLPWFARWTARGHFKWLRVSQSPLAFLESAAAILMLYWVAPATLVLFWARYMTLEDLRGTTLHVLLVVGAVTAAMNFPRMAGKTFRSGTRKPVDPDNPSNAILLRVLRATPLGIGAVLFLLSAGTLLGIPHDYRNTTNSPSSVASRWAPDLLWTAGYNPFAQLTETDVSAKPFGWTGRDAELSQVKGANLNRLRLRYIQAYGAFLARARLWQADLQNACLSEADLREANLRQADLRFAAMDGARLARASLPEANLTNSDLDQADLSEANLSFARLSESTLLDAKLDGANLYKADAHAATLQRASLKKADLREANLQGANLVAASLSESYLISTNLAAARLKGADLSRAMLTGANLRKADLTGTLLAGAVLRDADLTGANLQDADLRGVEGLGAIQACSASSLRGAQMDDSLQQQITTLCGNLR